VIARLFGAALVALGVTQVAAQDLTPNQRDRQGFEDAAPGLRTFDRVTDGVNNRGSDRCGLKSGCDVNERRPTYYDGADRSRAAEKREYGTEQDR
jgi:hypothetical protein